MMQLCFDGFIKKQIRANKNVNQINIDYVNAFFGRKRAEAKNINKLNKYDVATTSTFPHL